MQGVEAKELLGFSPNSQPSLSQISEAYSYLLNDKKSRYWSQADHVRVVRTGVPKVGGRSNPLLVKAPFLILMMTTLSFGGVVAARAYRKQREAFPSRHPFLP